MYSSRRIHTLTLCTHSHIRIHFGLLGRRLLCNLFWPMRLVWQQIVRVEADTMEMAMKKKRAVEEGAEEGGRAQSCSLLLHVRLQLM